MAILRDQYSKQICDRLFELAGKLKIRTRAGLTDANHSLETVMMRFFNALYGWELVNLNSEERNFPAVDLGDRNRRIAMQVTNQATGDKIVETANVAARHRLGKDFDRLIIFFLAENKPSVPKSFVQPLDCPPVECLDLSDLLRELIESAAFESVKRAAAVLEAETNTHLSATPLQSYFKVLRDNFSTYENLGLPPPANAEDEKDVRIAIRDLFVEPTFTTARVSPEEFDVALQAGDAPANRLLPVLAGSERRFVLLADPGMGKSTLIQWLVTTLADEDSLPPGAERLRGAVPLPFILRDIVGHLPKEASRWNWAAIMKAFERYHPRAADRPPLASALTANEEAFRTLLASERAFFLIDGLDEVSDPEHRQALRRALWQGFDQHPKARWLVTSRWVGYAESAVHERVETRYAGCGATWSNTSSRVALARLLYLAPFDDSQQLTFARNWYLPRMGEPLGRDRAAAFVKAVREHSSVRTIGRIPNLLYLLALLYRNRAHLPHGRSHVYSAISDAYLGGIDLTKHLHVPYELARKEQLLALVARNMQERRVGVSTGGKDNNLTQGGVGEVLVTRRDLQGWLSPHFSGPDGQEALNAFIGYVAARSGLLLPRGEEVFGFAHLSFQEYYAAVWLEHEFRRLLNDGARGKGGFLRRSVETDFAGRLSRADFPQLAAQTNWRESLVFLVEKLSANIDDTFTLIDWLFPQLDHEASEIEGEESIGLLPLEAARLLTAFSLDPQVCFTSGQRQEVWRVLWKMYLARQDSQTDWHLAPSLIVPSEFQSQVWDVLASLQPIRLLLRDTGIVDLAPVGGLNSLQTLDLHDCKTVVDLAPLKTLTRLESVWLDGTSVADLRPLVELKRIRTLNLSNCGAIGDLSPLKDLAMLERLYLNCCPGVTDLAALSGLVQLKELFLDGCSNLSSVSLAAFQASRPDVIISGP